MFSRSNSIKDLSISVPTSMLFEQTRACKYDSFRRVQGIASKTFYFVCKKMNNPPDRIK